MSISMDAANALERVIDGKIAKAAPKRTAAEGTVTRVDADGTAYVRLDGSDVDTPAARTAAKVKPGQRVSGTVRDGELVIDGNYSAPATDDTTANVAIKSAKKAAKSAKSAQDAADEAQKVADATNQHFWHDDNGVHVTEAEGNAETEHNILMNSLGILLRKALYNLVSITASAVAFFDGQGNTAEHITAQFGGDGTKLYADGALRHKTDVDGSHYYATDGETEVLKITNGTIGGAVTRFFALLQFPGNNKINGYDNGITVLSDNSSELFADGDDYQSFVEARADGRVSIWATDTTSMNTAGIDIDVTHDRVRTYGDLVTDGDVQTPNLAAAGTSTDYYAVGMQGPSSGGSLRYKTAAQFRSWLGLDALFKTASASQAWSSNIAAGGTQNVTVTLTVPSGYTIAAIRRVSSGNANVDIAGFYISGSTVVVALHNATSSARSSNNGVTVEALLAKSAFFG